MYKSHFKEIYGMKLNVMNKHIHLKFKWRTIWKYIMAATNAEQYAYVTSNIMVRIMASIAC